MMRATKINRVYRESGALNSLINVHALLCNNHILTKSGDLISLLSLEGVDPEGLEPDHVDSTARQFQRALGSLGEECRLYQYIFKSEAPAIAHDRYPNNPVLDQAVQNHIEHLSERPAPLYEYDHYLAVAFEGALASTKSWRWQQIVSNPVAYIRRAFSTNERARSDNEQLKKEQERLTQKLQGLTVQLQDSVKPVVLDRSEIFRFLRRLLNYDPHKSLATLQFDTFIDWQACGSSLDCFRDHLRVDDYYVKVLTLKEPPTRTSAHMFKQLHDVHSNLIAVSEWKPSGPAALRKLIQSKRRHFHNSKKSFLNYATSTATPASDMLVDDSAQAMVQGLGECLSELEVHGNGFGEFSLTIVLYDKDLTRLKRSVADCFKVFANDDAQLIEERYNVLNAFLAILPGNHLFNLRRMWLSAANYADLSFLFKVHPGERLNKHLNAEYLAVLETEHGTPYFLNLHRQDVGHTLVLGATGSGKSFLLNFLITHAQKYAPRVLIFDLGGSYRNLTHLFGGSYLAIAAGEWPFTINPFVLAPTEENLRFLLWLVLVLIGSNGYEPTADDEKDVYEQIKNLYEIESSQRRLSTLANVLTRPLRRELQKWVHPGPYATLFDNADDTLTFSRFQTFDFEGMAKSPMLEPLLFYILHRATAAIHNQEESTVFKLFVLDEVWRFLQHPTIRHYVLEALKTWRRRNAAVVMATQSTDDLQQSAMMNVVVESSPTKLFLANPDMNRDAYRSIFHLTEAEVDLIAVLTPKRQFLLKQPGLAKVLNLEVDQKGYWIYTNDPYDNQKKREAFEQYGFEEGLNILARSPK